MVYSLAMVVDRTATGFAVLAPWLQEPVEAPTWQEAYELAMRARRGA